MHSKGWDARRRNRNIGTKKSGHGQDNRLTIPESWADNRLFHERLNNPITIEREINGNLITFLIEEIQSGFCHACTPQDIEFLLRLFPSVHLARIKMIVLRQPKAKERILSPVWGRLLYWSEIGLYSGPAIHLEAQLVNGTIRWDKSLTPDKQLELERLQHDGHKILSDRRSYRITSDLLAIRNTQLYRTLPHEIGHYVDYLESVTIRAGDDQDEREKLDSVFRTKPSKDKEDFAHRYATTFYEQQVKQGHIPFSRIFDSARLAESGLDPRWFSV
jgi:predicted SprT family Zn-dependent metalloprotease